MPLVLNRQYEVVVLCIQSIDDGCRYENVLIFSKTEFSISARASSLSRHKYILVYSANNRMTDSMSFTVLFI